MVVALSIRNRIYDRVGRYLNYSLFRKYHQDDLGILPIAFLVQYCNVNLLATINKNFRQGSNIRNSFKGFLVSYICVIYIFNGVCSYLFCGAIRMII